MELQDLRYFCLAAELEHVTQAADILGVSQPFLSKVIRRLEEEYETPLFERSGRSIKLNEYGRVLYKRAKHLISEADNIKTELDELQGKKEKSIHLMTNVVVYMSRLIDTLNDVYPDFSIFVTSTTLKRIKKAVHANTIDFALCTPPLNEEIDYRIKTDIVHHERIMVMLPPRHPLRDKTVIPVRELHGQPLVISPKGFGMRIAVDEVLMPLGVQPQIMVETGEAADIIEYVKNGIGFAFFPESVIKRTPDLQDYCFHLDIDAVKPVGLSYHNPPYLSEAKQAFRDFIVDYFRGESLMSR